MKWFDNNSAYNRRTDASIRILIAGDNPNIAQAMSVMIQKSNPDWDVYEICLSGRETIDKTNELHPDIIVIDLKTNGIDTIRTIQDTFPSVHFICMAPTKDFDAIQEVLRLGASDYFVQPVDHRELLSAIQKAVAAILARKEAAQRELHTQERIETALSIIRKDFVKTLMPSAPQDRRLLSYASFLGITEQEGFILAILCRKKPTFKIPETIVYRLSTRFDLFGSSVEKGLAVAFVPTAQRNHADRAEILTYLDALLTQFHQDGEELICGVGNVFSSAPQMKLSLLQALSALNYFESTGTSYKRYIIFDETFMTLPEDNISEKNPEEPVLPSVKGSLDYAINYMKINYQRELTLNEVASSVNLSPYYFSRVFKKYTGDNFSKFLLKIRIGKAKELLADKNNSIKKVAYLVGFNDPNYFSKVFHNTTGIKASEYKE